MNCLKLEDSTAIQTRSVGLKVYYGWFVDYYLVYEVHELGSVSLELVVVQGQRLEYLNLDLRVCDLQ